MCRKGRLHAWWVCWLLVLSHAQTGARSQLLTDEDFGIRVYNLMVPFGGLAQHLRLFLRSSCREQNSILVYGFIGMFPIHTDEPVSPDQLHYTSHRRNTTDTEGPQLVLINRVDKRSTPLAVIGSKLVEFRGFLRVEAVLANAGRYDISTAEASWKLPLAVPCCSCKLSNSDSSSQSNSSNSSMSSSTWNTTSPFVSGLWNVLTTTSNPGLAMEDLAFLILQHHRYHRRAGFKGTIVRGSTAQAQLLSKMDILEKALTDEGLLLWPWDTEHSTYQVPYFWQIPKNQITLLAAYHRGVRLAFLDLDEYLVFNKATGSSLDSATCNSQPLLQAGAPAWNLMRYQSKTCDHGSDLKCWKEGLALPAMAKANLYMDMCAMGPGHGKLIVEADLVLNVNVHKPLIAPTATTSTASISPDCAFIIHLFSLAEIRRNLVSLKIMTYYPVSQWQLPAAGAGPAVVTPPPGHRVRLQPECEADNNKGIATFAGTLGKTWWPTT